MNKDVITMHFFFYKRIDINVLSLHINNSLGDFSDRIIYLNKKLF